jgi:8-amino-7-oxononanoate synthase
MTGSAAAPVSCTLSAALRQELDTLAAAGLHRQHRILKSPCGREIQVAGQKLINFASNDYLGLAADPRLIEALAAGQLFTPPVRPVG